MHLYSTNGDSGARITLLRGFDFLLIPHSPHPLQYTAHSHTPTRIAAIVYCRGSNVTAITARSNYHGRNRIRRYICLTIAPTAIVTIIAILCIPLRVPPALCLTLQASSLQHYCVLCTAAAVAATAGSSRPRTMRRLYCCACMYMPVLRCKQAPCSTTVCCARRRL